MPKNPDRPKIKYKHVKKPPPPNKTPEEIAAQSIARLEQKHRINPRMVSQLIAKEYGLLTPICRSLKIPRTTLQRYIEKHPECQDAMANARDAMGDKAEKKLHDLIEQGDIRCLLFYLSTVQGHRGYKINGSGINSGGDDGSGNRPVFVETVNIVGIPRGTFLPKEIAAQDNMVIEGN